MFRFVSKPCCISCGQVLIPTTPKPEEPKRKTSWDRLLDD